MDATPKPLKAALEAIRGMASNALTQIDQAQETCSMRWKCKDCRYTKHFTRPESLNFIYKNDAGASVMPYVEILDASKAIFLIGFKGDCNATR